MSSRSCRQLRELCSYCDAGRGVVVKGFGNWVTSTPSRAKSKARVSGPRLKRALVMLCRNGTLKSIGSLYRINKSSGAAIQNTEYGLKRPILPAIKILEFISNPGWVREADNFTSGCSTKVTLRGGKFHERASANHVDSAALNSHDEYLQMLNFSHNRNRNTKRQFLSLTDLFHDASFVLKPPISQKVPPPRNDFAARKA